MNCFSSCRVMGRIFYVSLVVFVNLSNYVYDPNYYVSGLYFSSVLSIFYKNFLVGFTNFRANGSSWNVESSVIFFLRFLFILYILFCLGDLRFKFVILCINTIFGSSVDYLFVGS